MPITIHEERPDKLSEYAAIPVAFSVDAVVDLSVVPVGRRLVALPTATVPRPYHKDYDAIAGNEPGTWPFRLDRTEWVILAAFAGGRRAAGAVVALDNQIARLIDGSAGDAVVWDIRVVPDLRRHGIGSALFAGAEAWAHARGCARLLVETQDINVSACQFYSGRGCVLSRINRRAYRDLPDEVQLVWSKPIGNE